jgi:hypothetical protein
LWDISTPTTTPEADLPSMPSHRDNNLPPGQQHKSNIFWGEYFDSNFDAIPLDISIGKYIFLSIGRFFISDICTQPGTATKSGNHLTIYTFSLNNSVNVFTTESLFAFLSVILIIIKYYLTISICD